MRGALATVTLRKEHRGCGQCGMERSEDGGGNKQRPGTAAASK